MARRGRSVLEDLTMLPWWVNVILAVVVYLSCKYWVPSIAFQTPLFKGIAIAVASCAPVAAGLLVFVAVISALNAWRKSKLLDRCQRSFQIEPFSVVKSEPLGPHV